MLVLDIDGVLTDGGLYYDQNGLVSQRFHVHDGFGLKIAREAGLSLAIVTGRSSPAATARVKDLGVEHYYSGYVDKAAAMNLLRKNLGINFDQMAFLGDDWLDAPAMRLVSLPMAVANARPEILKLAAWVSSVPGGLGAVREAVEFLLSSQGLLDEQLRRFSLL